MRTTSPAPARSRSEQLGASSFAYAAPKAVPSLCSRYAVHGVFDRVPMCCQACKACDVHLALQKRLPGVKSGISRASGAKADILYEPGDTIRFGSQSLQVLPTPGELASGMRPSYGACTGIGQVWHPASLCLSRCRSHEWLRVLSQPSRRRPRVHRRHAADPRLRPHRLPGKHVDIQTL